MATSAVPAPLRQLPNALTILRLALIPVFVVLMLADDGANWPAGIVFGVAGITDQVDGWLARRWHVESEFGKVADPLADRLMIDAAALMLWVDGRIPWYAALVILARDLLLVAGYKLVVPRGYDFEVNAPRQARHLGALRVAGLPDRHRRGHRLAALALLDRRGACAGRRRAVPAEGAARGPDVKAVVMAGGEGTRLRPLTSNQPKPMVPIVGKPCMEHILELLRPHGFEEVVVTLAFMPQAIRSYFGTGETLGLSIEYSVEQQPPAPPARCASRAPRSTRPSSSSPATRSATATSPSSSARTGRRARR